ncbi:MAG: hypothetical protein AAGG55_11750 [Pseudomonadota bacterium]
MFIDEESGSDARVSTSTALRHVIVFQLKLAADALRDFLLSPLSIVAFMLDAIRKPRVEKSLYLRLMLIGRRSDRMINLFDDHQDAGSFTIDSAVDELEQLLRSGQRKEEPETTSEEESGAADVDAGAEERA